jgi:hypothetical protein
MAEVVAHLDHEHAAAKATYDAIPAHVRTRRPSENAWSPDETLAHLVFVESRVAKTMAGSIAKAREGGLGADTQISPLLPGMDLSRLLDRSQKIVAPAAIDPIQTAMPTATWADYDAAREALKAALLTGDGLDLSSVKQPHPVFGAISLYEWAAFVGAHEARHAAQMREAAES